MKTLLLLVTISISVTHAYDMQVTVTPDYSNLQDIRDGSYQRLILPGSHSLGNEGEPDLPYLPVRVSIPAGTEVTNVDLIECTYETLPDLYRVVPIVWQLCSIDHWDELPEPDPEIYGMTSYYPAQSMENWDSGTLWGFPILGCWLRPVQWNPSTGEIRILRSAELTITCEPDPNQRRITRRTQWSEETSVSIIRSMVTNPMSVCGSGAAIIAPRQLEYGQYVIVTIPEYHEAMQELADWKTSKGIPAEIYTTDWIVSRYPFIDLQQSIRGFLTDCISEGTDFVLLVGDNDVLEARFTSPAPFTDTSLPTDLYFADINDDQPGSDRWDSNNNGIWGESDDDVDWHPDLWVGRASVNSVEEAEIFVRKVLIYEHASDSPVAGSDWGTSIGYTTGYLSMGGGGSNPGSEYAETVSAMVPSHWTETKCYESWGNNSTAITIDMINEGQGNIYHVNHGSPTAMYTAYGDMFTVDDIMQLQNIAVAGAVTIWNSLACDLGSFDTLTCCADAWLNSPDGGGFGVFNARGIFTSISSQINEGFYNIYLNEDLPLLGIVHGLSLDRLCPPGGNGGFIQASNLFGDPELPMWIAPSGPLAAEHPGAVTGAGYVSIHVTDRFGSNIENARVCLQQDHWKTGAVYEVAYTDVSGNASLWVEPETPGEISVTAWALDYDHYSGVITAGYELPEDELAIMWVFSSPSATPGIYVALGEPAMIEINIYDLSGRMIRTPVHNTLGAGSHEILLDDLYPGAYFARMRIGETETISPFMVITD